MYIIFLVLVVLLMLVPTVDAFIEKKKPKNVVITEKMLCKKYGTSIAFFWGTALIVFIMCFIAKKNPVDIGFRNISFNYNIWFTSTSFIMGGLVFAYSLSQIIQSFTSAKFREVVKKQVTEGGGASGMLPRSNNERWMFSFLSISAGTCEEILYRGFMVFLLQTIFPDIPIYLIILLPNVLFRIGHYAQGLGGVIITGVGATVFMCLYLATGSLIPSILLHIFFDFSNTFLLLDEQRV